MRTWEVKTPEAADALITAMNEGLCRSEEQAEAIAAKYGDVISWHTFADIPAGADWRSPGDIGA